jgi:hypothetical protein
MDRRPRWETRGHGGDVDPTRPARFASSRRRRVRTSHTVPLRVPRRCARLSPRRPRPYRLTNGQQSALAADTALHTALTAAELDDRNARYASVVVHARRPPAPDEQRESRGAVGSCLLRWQTDGAREVDHSPLLPRDSGTRVDGPDALTHSPRLKRAGLSCGATSAATTHCTRQARTARRATTAPREHLARRALNGTESTHGAHR